MSRIGRKIIPIPSGVTVEINEQAVSVKGKEAELLFTLDRSIAARITTEGVRVNPRASSKESLSMWGTSRTMIQNAIIGVESGFEKRLQVSGVGYRAQIKGTDLQLALGFSHDIIYPIPSGIRVKCLKPTEMLITGISKQAVGQVAAEIRRFRPPEPYKGKGIHYVDEFITRKEGKNKKK